MVVKNSPVADALGDLFGDLIGFIQDEHIDPQKVKRYNEILALLEERRDYWALNKQLAPIDSLKIYGGYSTIYSTLYGVARALKIGIERRENPKAAKEVYSIVSEASQLASKLEQVHLKGNKAMIPSRLIGEIFEESRRLRRQAISKQLIPVGQTTDRKELVKKLLAQIENQNS